jgi:hypothetical protein
MMRYEVTRWLINGEIGERIGLKSSKNPTKIGPKCAQMAFWRKIAKGKTSNVEIRQSKRRGAVNLP